MGEVIRAEHIFLKSKEAHIQAMQVEGELRDLAAKSASLYHAGLHIASSRIILEIPQENKKMFRLYLEEYLKHYKD